MSKLNTLKNLVLKNPSQILVEMGRSGLLNFLPSKTYLKLVYKSILKEKLNLENPKTIAEKLQWLKLYDRKDSYKDLVDKASVRDIIKRDFGEENLIPLIGTYSNVSDIDWDSLPKSFVIKCTHGSGCNIVCRDKSKLDINSAKKDLNKWMKRNWYWYGREYPYKNIKPKILIEEFVADNDEGNDLTDYKFYCFEGEPTYCQVIGEREDERGYYIDFFDMEWNKTELSGMAIGHRHKEVPISRPESFEKMYSIAKKMSAGVHFVRIDFYEINGKAIFGEFTLYPKSGFGCFTPIEWNKKLGDMIKLP